MRDRSGTSALAAALCFLLLLLPATTAGAELFEDATLAPDGGAQGERFGLSISIDGDTAVVGAPRAEDPEAESRPGAAYVFVASGNDWSQQQRLAAADGEDADLFGHAVAVSGDTLVVGAPRVEEEGIPRGAAYVYVRSGGVWSLEATLRPRGPDARPRFGAAVALEGDTLLVGAPRDDRKAVDAGAVYVFERDGTTWSETDKIPAPGPPASMRFADFGFRVAIDDDTFIVGAPGRSSFTGAAYVYAHDGSDWALEQRLTAEADADEENAFGRAVDVSGDTAVVGSPLEEAGTSSAYEDDGAAYVFTRESGLWTREARLLPAEGNDFMAFGRSVAVVGDRAVVGAPGAEVDEEPLGAAYEFERDGTTWTEGSLLLAEEPSEYDEFGVSISYDGVRAAVGAPLREDATMDVSELEEELVYEDFAYTFTTYPAPEITCPPSVEVECDASTAPANSGTATATPEDPAPAIQFADEVAAGECAHEETITRTWTATDDLGRTDTCEQTITVVDSTSPAVTCSVSRAMLWPPRRALLPVGVIAASTDNCDETPSLLLGVISNEDDGGPPFAPDVVPAGTDLRLRAERAWPGSNGRIYVVVAAAIDACGNVGCATASVLVPTVPTVSVLTALAAEAAAMEAQIEGADCEAFELPEPWVLLYPEAD